MLGAKAVQKQRLEIAERDSAIDRTASGEGDYKRVCAAGEALRTLGRVLKRIDSVLEHGDLSRVGCRTGWPGVCLGQSRGDRLRSQNDLLRWCNAEETCCRLVVRKSPDRRCGSGEDQHERHQQPRT